MSNSQRTVAIIGAGLIGRAWANVFARAGWSTRVWDPDPKALERAPGLIAQSLADLARHGLVADPEGSAKRVTAHATLEEAVTGAALVQENGPERVEVKIDLFARLDKAAAPETILASSSSAIVSSRFAEKLPGRHRILIAHPVNPPHVVPIVELCGAPWTSPEVIAKARAIYDSVGQVSMEVKKEIDGFILNRMQAVLLAEAFRLVGEGYCTPQDLDKTIAHGLGLRWSFMGPFETIEMNAPGGIRDYAARYGTMLAGLASRPYTADVFGADNVDRIMREWGREPTAADVETKSRRRDDRLAALQAHKRSSKPYSS